MVSVTDVPETVCVADRFVNSFGEPVLRRVDGLAGQRGREPKPRPQNRASGFMSEQRRMFAAEELFWAMQRFSPTTAQS